MTFGGGWLHGAGDALGAGEHGGGLPAMRATAMPTPRSGVVHDPKKSGNHFRIQVAILCPSAPSMTNSINDQSKPGMWSLTDRRKFLPS